MKNLIRLAHDVFPLSGALLLALALSILSSGLASAHSLGQTPGGPGSDADPCGSARQVIFVQQTALFGQVQSVQLSIDQCTLGYEVAGGDATQIPVQFSPTQNTNLDGTTSALPVSDPLHLLANEVRAYSAAHAQDLLALARSCDNHLAGVLVTVSPNDLTAAALGLQDRPGIAVCATPASDVVGPGGN